MKDEWALPYYSCKCHACGWKGKRIKANARLPCPVCQHYPVKMDSRQLMHYRAPPSQTPWVNAPKGTNLRKGVTLTEGPYAGWTSYRYSSAKLDGGRTYLNLYDPKTKKRRQIAPLRYAACIRFGRVLPEHLAVLPRDGNRENDVPENTLVIPNSKMTRVLEMLRPKHVKECDWCGTSFQTADRRRGFCSPECRKEIKNAAQKERYHEHMRNRRRQQALDQGRQAVHGKRPDHCGLS